MFAILLKVIAKVAWHRYKEGEFDKWKRAGRPFEKELRPVDRAPGWQKR